MAFLRQSRAFWTWPLERRLRIHVVSLTPITGVATEAWTPEIHVVTKEHRKGSKDDATAVGAPSAPPPEEKEEEASVFDFFQQQSMRSRRGGRGGAHHYAGAQRFEVWDRVIWPFGEPEEPGGRGVRNQRVSELPMALAVSKHGFVVLGPISPRATDIVLSTDLERPEDHSDDDDDSDDNKAHDRSSRIRTRSKLHWASAHAPGVPVPLHVTTEFLADVQAMRKCFFPEKVRRVEPKMMRNCSPAPRATQLK